MDNLIDFRTIGSTRTMTIMSADLEAGDVLWIGLENFVKVVSVERRPTIPGWFATVVTLEGGRIIEPNGNVQIAA